MLSLHHLVTGIFLAIKGYDKIQHHHAFIGSIILISGIAILAYYLFISIKKKENHKLNLLVHLCEGLALLFTSYIFFKDGKTYLPYVTLLAGGGFLVAVCIHFFKKQKHGNQH